MKKLLDKSIEYHLEELFDIATVLYENPEISEQEVMSSQLLADFIESRGFDVEKPYLGQQNGFKAVYHSGKPGLNVALFCEYDALPGIGHGCGHNLICTTSFAAGLALKEILDEIGGTVTLFGTPAEETNGVKGVYGDMGAYDDIDFAIMVHPCNVSMSSGTSLALKPLQFEYFGKTAHAAACPEEGINALDSVIQLFNGINAIRQHVTPDVRIHGIIDNGGLAPNVVPDYASAKFYLRAFKKSTIETVEKKVLGIAEGAALMTGARLEVSNFEFSYDDLVSNQVLSKTFDENLKNISGEFIGPAEVSGSVDMGNVSYYVPAIHPMVGIGNDKLVIHSKEFADATVSELGKPYLYKAARALAYTAYDVMTKPELFAKIKEEFDNMK